MEKDEPLRRLHASLDRRHRPEDVAQLVVGVMGSDLGLLERRRINKATKHALQNLYGWSSMASDFARPIGMQRQLRTARQLFPALTAPGDLEADQPELMGDYVALAAQTIRKPLGKSHFLEDRLHRAARKAAGLGDMSKRRYNKLFRLVARMEAKRDRLSREWKKRALTQISKSRLAARVPWDEFAKDINTACFVAYYAARCSLRSVFSGTGQKGAYDDIADMLFRRCTRAPETTNWWAIAHVHPVQEVLARLSDAQRGMLLGTWFSILDEAAGLLRDVWHGSEINRKTMIVRRENDSSTWNLMAGAWNKARDAWINLVYAMRMEPVLDGLCFGKVLRLMAADVAAWHRSLGKDVDPDTLVWNELPLPWEVLQGNATCTRKLIEAACRRFGVDPEANGWTAPRPAARVETFTPTPELVHGVSVSSPRLAAALKRAGWFSGKTARDVDPGGGSIVVFDDPHGFAVHVEDEATLDQRAQEPPDSRRRD